MEQLDYILIDSILCRETLCPCKEKALVKRRLFDGEREGKTKRYCGGLVIDGVWFVRGPRRFRFRIERKKFINRVGEVV